MRTKQQTKNIKIPKCPWIPNRQTHAWVSPDLAWPVASFSWIVDDRLISVGRQFLVDLDRGRSFGRGFGSWTLGQSFDLDVRVQSKL
jgi:hypothetical protein